MFLNFVKSLLTNRFGIVLGTLNVVYFFSQIINLQTFHTEISEKAFICMNIPAIISSVLPSMLIESLFRILHVAPHQIRIFSLAVFMMIQWLLIAHLARILARNLKFKL